MSDITHSIESEELKRMAEAIDAKNFVETSLLLEIIKHASDSQKKAAIDFLNQAPVLAMQNKTLNPEEVVIISTNYLNALAD